MKRTWIVMLLFIAAVQTARAGAPLSVVQRLNEISIRRCEVASFSNVSRVIQPSVARRVSVEAELGKLPPGFIISAHIRKTRRIEWPVALASPGEDLVPLVESWKPVPTEAAVDLFYFSAERSCSDLLRHSMRVVLSGENGGCDTSPSSGWCIIDDHRVVSDVPTELKQYVKRRYWWQQP